MSAIAALLPDGRLHLQYGPIDCLCRAWGEPGEVRAAYNQAVTFFATVLDDLCAELPLLRSALPAPRPAGPVAGAMHEACMPFADRFITPMAAVAGAVADAVLAAMVKGRDLPRAFVNNGGDIAFHLTPGTSLRCGLVTDLAAVVMDSAGPFADPSLPARQDREAYGAGSLPDRHGRACPGHPHTTGGGRMAGTRPAMTGDRFPHHADTDGIRRIAPDGTLLLTFDHPARGLATSGRACKGRGGRSFSFGIADSVTILARTAARADAAATVVGNEVDLPGHPAIDRRPASDIDPASDLGDRLITFDVGVLDCDAIKMALDAGETVVDILLRNGMIEGAILALHGRFRVRHPSCLEVT